MPGARAKRHLLIGQAVVAQRHRPRPGRHHFVQRRHRVARAELTGVLAVVLEVLLREQPVLVAQEPVRLHPRRVELDLDLHVLGHREERPAELLHEHLLRLAEAVDVGVVAVPLVGHLLHLRVLEVAGAEAQHGEECSLLPALLHQPDSYFLYNSTNQGISALHGTHHVAQKSSITTLPL